MFLGLALLAAACGGAEPTTPPPHGPADDAAMAQLTKTVGDALAARGVPGAAMAVVVNGKLAHHAEFGVKKAGAIDPITPHTRFCLASLSKTFTAATVVKLGEDGAIDIGAPVTTYVPFFRLRAPDSPSQITTRHLLTHTSGYPDSPTTTVGYQGAPWDDLAPDALAQMFRSFADVPLYSPPGAVWDYTNFGYALAGLEIAQVTGRSFAEAATARILQPAGMADATYDAGVAGQGDRSAGHVHLPSGQMAAADLSDFASNTLGPYGGLFATAIDVARFAEVLAGDRDGVLAPRSIQQMATAAVDTHASWPAATKLGQPGPTTSYGYGLFVSDFGPTRVVWHDGGFEGFETSLWMIPERKFALVLLVNADTYYPNVHDHFVQAAKLFLGLDLAPTLRPPRDGSALVGTYVDDRGALGTITFSLEGGQLYAQVAAEQYRTRVYPMGGDDFAFAASPKQALVLGAAAMATLYVDEAGKGKYLVTRAGVGRAQ
jgi:CubicO group peptidase (beta-lactamase class C family)